MRRYTGSSCPFILASLQRTGKVMTAVHMVHVAAIVIPCVWIYYTTLAISTCGMSPIDFFKTPLAIGNVAGHACIHTYTHILIRIESQ